MKILFISHIADRSGAPILLNHILHWLEQHKPEVQSSLLVMKSGNLLSEYPKGVNLLLWDKEVPRILKPWKKFWEKKYKKNLIQKMKRESWELIFSNTIINGEILTQLHLPNIPTISYIHELETLIKENDKGSTIKGTFNYTDFFLTGSDKVKQNLVKNHSIPENKIETLYSFQNVEKKSKNLSLSNQLKKELDIPNNAFVVGMLGNMEKRKGADWFFETANFTQKDIYFVWIGGNQLPFSKELEKNLQNQKGANQIRIIPATKEYEKYFSMIDVFFLSSREDTYPLAMVEASSYGIPILAFEGAGGADEFVDSSVGQLIPMGNLPMVAEKIEQIKGGALKFDSEKIQQKSLETHDIEKAMPKLWDLIIQNINP